MRTYHKIQSIFKRDKDTHKFMFDEFSLPEFELLAKVDWVWTEKIDGTNIRVDFYTDGNEPYNLEPSELVMTIGGRTDRAEIPNPLLTVLNDTFDTLEVREVVLNQMISHDIKGITLFGEGFGGKIQKGQKYGDYDFILFDVFVDDTFWLPREYVDAYAELLNIRSVPIILVGNFDHAINFVADGFESTISKEPMPAEGLVGVPKYGILDSRGKRIVTKLKTRDFN